MDVPYFKIENPVQLSLILADDPKVIVFKLFINNGSMLSLYAFSGKSNYKSFRDGIMLRTYYTGTVPIENCFVGDLQLDKKDIVELMKIPGDNNIKTILLTPEVANFAPPNLKPVKSLTYIMTFLDVKGKPVNTILPIVISKPNPCPPYNSAD